jgi:hypothetical protein
MATREEGKDHLTFSATHEEPAAPANTEPAASS